MKILSLSMPFMLLIACRSNSMSVAPAADPVVNPVVNPDIHSASALANSAQPGTKQLSHSRPNPWPAKAGADLEAKERISKACVDSTPEPDSKEEKPIKLCAPITKVEINDPDFTSVARRMEEVMAYTGTPGAAMAVAHNGQIIWEKGFGWANREKRIRATADTPFSMASISKPFTATAIMMLEERGLIDLDAPINNYLGEFGVWAGAGETDQATIRRVLSHRAGLPLHAHFYYANRPFPVPTSNETMQRYAALITPPGERFQYSNLGYGILGFLITQVSGQRYEDFMHDEIFAPLGLEHTGVGIPRKYRKQAAKRYQVGGRRLADYTVDHPAASSIYASVHDLAGFGMFHLGHVGGDEAIVSSKQLAKMRVSMEEEDRYGLGWAVRREDGAFVFRHNGAMFGVSSELRIVLEQDLVIAIAGNSKTMRNRVHWLVQKVMNVLGVPARSDSICALPPKDQLIGTWSGTVRSPKGTLPVRLEVEASGEVYATIANQHRQIVRGVELKEGVLGGLFEADIGAEQANGSSIMELNLRIHETSLDGAIFSIDPLAGVVSHWIRLEQSETTASIDESMSRLPRKIQGSFVDKLCFTCSKTSQYFSPSGAPIRSNRSMLSGLSG